MFTYQSVVSGSAEMVFRWHERPDALLDLSPSRRWTRIEEKTGGVRNGDTVTFSVGVGAFRLRWRARHFGYIRDRQFCDEQVIGPFKVWRHTHRVEPARPGECVYEDRLEYEVSGGALVQTLADPILRRFLTSLFRFRHGVVRAAFPDARQQLPSGDHAM